MDQRIQQLVKQFSLGDQQRLAPFYMGLICYYIYLQTENNSPFLIEKEGPPSHEDLERLIESEFSFFQVEMGDFNLSGLAFDTPKGDLLSSVYNNLSQLLHTKAITYDVVADSLPEMVESLSATQWNDSTTPKELCTLLNSLLPEAANSIYCPYSSSPFVAASLSENKLVFTEGLDRHLLLILELMKRLSSRAINVAHSNPINNPSYVDATGLVKFDASLAFPAIGRKVHEFKSNDVWGRFPEKALTNEVYALRHMLAQSDFVACYVSNGFLFRSAAGESQFKQDILGRGWLKAVIALPEKLLASTNIPVSLIILDKSHQKDEVIFIDASGDKFKAKLGRNQNQLVNIPEIITTLNSFSNTAISSVKTAEDIAQNDLNWSSARYVLTEEQIRVDAFLDKHELEELSSRCQIIRPQAIKHEETSSSSEFIEFGIGDIDSTGSLTGNGRSIKATLVNATKARKQLIRPGDVLLVCKGAIGKLAIVPDDIPENSIASQVFAILRHNSGSILTDPEVLFMYLSSSIAQAKLRSITSGTTALMIASKALSSFPVPVFSEEEEDKAKKAMDERISIQSQIRDLQDKIRVLEDQWLLD